MKNFLCFCFVLFFSIGFLNAQNLVYTVSGELNNEKTALDSIIVENKTNNTRIVFGDLPVQDFYEIELTEWNTTGVNNYHNSSGFIASQNIPGLLILTNISNIETEVGLSIYDISGKKMYVSDKKLLNANNSIKIELGVTGIFMVKLDSPLGIQSFKTIGSVKSKAFNIDIIEKNTSRETLKNAEIATAEDFSFKIGDSIQISVSKKDYLSLPEGLKITESESINFNLYNIEFTDSRDNKVYQTVKIGNQIWLAENLAYLPHVSPSTIESPTDSLIYVNGYEGTDVSVAIQSEHFIKYGALYNWAAAQAVSPEGWHLPSEEEWRQLELYLGMSSEEIPKAGWRGTDEGSKLKSTSGWDGGNGTNETGFSALPGGLCCPFNGAGFGGYWWSSTEATYFAETGRGRGLDKDHTQIVVLGNYKKFGFSVRCLRD
ncbi:MAG: hypothetical protein HN778_02605 [Prolixibacteraceae bacterium]|nr:hypothetical protein [Prolixibacteraceae bacterium]MBT6765171.1 hypothetical protein [Prolixibacteraceae bacterium]MBT7001010.1 hypothetical protein [Prolixibacteraceae bacterium]MBT7393702.1 hypothetical protein [Prolixibacteraceae bacterium]